jgi:hypothetical protein
MTLRQWAIRRRYKLGRSTGRRMHAIILALFWLKQRARCSFTHRGDKRCSAIAAGMNTANDA